MVKLSELVFDRNAFPLRLIDLQSTLVSSGGVCFQLPSDWNFHVVSHTWSQDIRDLSVAVGHVLLESGWSTDQELHARGLCYNEAFSKPRFAENSSYEKLMEFFRVLVGDGASKVWFDALCINQKDDDEKAHEIRWMGAYYRLSTGCYVITHGIGSELGFKAAKTHSLDPVPRWFTRAWTIQESMLPEKLRFIVEKFDGTSITQFPDGGFLSILSKQWRDWDEALEPIEWEKGKKMGDVYRIRAYKEFYCLGADAYRRMMRIALHGAWQSSQFTKAFSELADADIHDHDIEVESVVKMVQQRHCSVEEDRVLSILGLLGIGGEHQLRTKRTLDHQLVWLAMTLMKENPKLLINLCASDLEGYAKRCISWLPDLRYAENRRFWTGGQDQYKHFVVDRHVARVKDVQDNGKIVLSARTLRGTLVREPFKLGFWLQFGESRVKFLGGLLPQPCLLSLEKESFHASGSTDRICGGLSIPALGIDRFKDLSTYESLSICEITLLMLGYCHPCDYPYTLAMACVGTTEEMQKVGILGFTQHEDLEFSSTFEDCLIGGFGDDLTCFLKEECRAFLPRVLPSPSENTLNQHSEDILSQHSEEDLEVLPNPFLRFFSLTWQVVLAFFVLLMALSIALISSGTTT